MDSLNVTKTTGYMLQSGTSCNAGVTTEETGSQQAAAENTILSGLAKKETESKSIIESMREAREQAEKRRDQFKIPKNTRYGDAAIMAYSRLARARSISEVSSAAGYARRRMSQLKAAKRQDSDNARRIQAVINQLQKVINRAGKKKTDLQSERLSELHRKKLEEEKQHRKAQRLQHQLQKRKIARKIRESGYIKEAETDNRMQDYIAKTEMELRQQMQTISESFQVSSDAAIQQYTTQMPAEASMPAPSIDVQA